MISFHCYFVRMLRVQIRFRHLISVRRTSCLAHLANVLNISSGFMFTDIETPSQAVVSGLAASPPSSPPLGMKVSSHIFDRNVIICVTYLT